MIKALSGSSVTSLKSTLSFIVPFSQNTIANNDEEYIIANYQKIAMYLTTPELKRNFNNAVQEIINMQNQNVDSASFHR